MIPDQVRALLRSLPAAPGVYLMKDAAGTVIYVGKAAVLRNRVRSYFQAGADHTLKVQQMVQRVADLEWIVVDSEAEALMLEANLVKRHRPAFNVRLKDDKHYPYLKIPVDEPWARVYVVRRVENDGARYFGPYASASSVRRTLDLLKKLFPYRSCTRIITGTDPRPCLDYYIHRCIGPCIGAATREEYNAVIGQVVSFLEGRQEDVVRDLRRAMEAASEDLQFERAAVLRDQLQAIERVGEQQKISTTSRADRDVIGLARGQDDACAMVFFVRNGKVVGREHFLLEGTRDEADGAVIGAFLQQFYETAPSIPPEILVPTLPEGADDLAAWLTSRRRGGQTLDDTPPPDPAAVPVTVLDPRLRAEREHDPSRLRVRRANAAQVRIQAPARGEKKHLVAMVQDNAAEVLNQQRVRWLADSDRTLGALEELADYLNLAGPPRRIECYDISNIQGTSSVGSMVVFENGQPKPSHYRRFAIKGVTGANDFASHQEVLRRRFRRALDVQTYQAVAEGTRSLQDVAPAMPAAGNEPPDEDAGDEPPSLSTDPGRGKPDPSFQEFPDLIIVDGGKGQLNADLIVLRELGLNSIPMVGLAKEQELLFLPDDPEPVYLPRTSQALYLVQRIRDDAHRFAITYHRQKRGKEQTRSRLDAIPGVGPTRRKALIRAFGSVAGIREATVDQIAAVPGIGPALAEAIHQQL